MAEQGEYESQIISEGKFEKINLSSFESVDDDKNFKLDKRSSEMVSSFNSIRKHLSPSHKNILHRIHKNSIEFYDIIIYDGKECIFLFNLDECYYVIYDGSVVSVGISEIEVCHGNIDDDMISYVYNEIFKIIDKSAFDYVSFFTTFADTFDVEEERLLKLIPYKFKDLIKDTLKKRYNLSSDEDGLSFKF